MQSDQPREASGAEASPRSTTNMERRPESTYRIGRWVVCFIDLQGQAERLNKWSNVSSLEDLEPETLQAIKLTAGTVIGFRDFFEEFFYAFEKLLDGDLALQIQNLGEREKIESYRQCKLRVQQFSDTFVFFAPLRNDRGELTPECLYRMLAASGMAMLFGLSGKVAMRGSITVGSGIEIDEKTFYGPALASAYYLESQIARYPRIILSREAEKELSRVRGFSDDPQIEFVTAGMFERMRRLVLRDVDGILTVDFMGEQMRETVRDIAGAPDMAKLAIEFVRSELARFTKAENDKLQPRYDQLLAYMLGRIGLWDASWVETPIS